jgi:CHAT domain-containing protein
VIHLATHGQFSSKAEETFLLTWDGRIKVKDLDRLVRSRERENTNPIELLVLSACQTAAGDNRAALGLAGLAVRSGARSTLATLWSVRDQSTAEFMAEFYRELTQTDVSKAEALRQAQLALLKKPKYEHPFYWAPFVLVGNWL